MKNVPTLIPAPSRERNWCIPFLHPWTKWKRHAIVEVTRRGRTVGAVAKQHRFCQRCNKLQVRSVTVV